MTTRVLFICCVLGATVQLYPAASSGEVIDMAQARPGEAGWVFLEDDGTVRADVGGSPDICLQYPAYDWTYPGACALAYYPESWYGVIVFPNGDLQEISCWGSPWSSLIPGPPGPVAGVEDVSVTWEDSIYVIRAGALFWQWNHGSWYGPCDVAGLEPTPRAWYILPDGNGDAPTIQAGIDSASHIDTVIVASGTYYEHDIQVSWGVTLKGESGDPADVTINAQGQGRVLICDSLDFGEIPPPTIEGLTLTGGSPGSHGGAVFLTHSSPVIINCNIIANSTGAPGYDGGGIFLRNDSHPTITACVIAGNSTEDKGGGIFCRNDSDPMIEGCIIADNTAATKGGALYCYNSCQPTVDSCTIYGNSASDGGGISVEGSSHVLASNTIIAFGTGGQAVFCDGGGSALIHCTDVYGNAGGDWVGCIEDQDSVAGNFCEDPLFCNPDSLDFRLDPGSPCLGGECVLVGAVSDTCDDLSAVPSHREDPVTFRFLASRPNPSNNTTQIKFSLPEAVRAVVSIHDVAGRRIAVLADRMYESGTHQVVWGGSDSSGHPVAPGVYFCRLEAGALAARQKIVLVK